MNADPLFPVDSLTPPAPNVRNGNIGTAQGTAAEMRLAAELLDRGHKVAIPICDDDGVDLVVDYATTVQVKSGAYRVPRTGALEIHLQRRGYKTQGQTRVQRAIQQHVDIVAVYARDTRSWWFIPRELTNNAKHIRVLETAQHGLSAWREAWELFVAPNQAKHARAGEQAA